MGAASTTHKAHPVHAAGEGAPSVGGSAAGNSSSAPPDPPTDTNEANKNTQLNTQSNTQDESDNDNDMPAYSSSAPPAPIGDAADPPFPSSFLVRRPSLSLEFASQAPPDLLQQGTSAATFAQLHTYHAPSSSSPHTDRVMGTRTPGQLARTISAPLSPDALSSLSDAIHMGLRPHSPQTPGGLLTQDAKEQKAILLSSIFQAIDRDSVRHPHAALQPTCD